MSYSQMIHEYLDEGLDGTRQDVLFARLADDPEMRQDFNQQVRIHVAAQSDMRTITPPVESTNAIFSALGFAIPSSDYVAPAGNIIPDPATTAKLVSLWRRHLTTALAVLITAGVTSLYFIGGNNGKPNTLISAGDVPKVSATAMVSAPTEQNASTAKESISQQSKQMQRTIRHPHLPLAGVSDESAEKTQMLAQNVISDGNIISSVPANNASAIEMSAFTPSMLPVNYNGMTQGILPVELAINQKELYFEPINIRRPAGSDWQLLLSHYSGNSINDVTVPVGNSSALNNWSIAVQRKVADNFRIGAEFGQDAFAQQFSESVNGEKINYKQKPSMYRIGGIVSYGYNLAELGLIGQYITPYARLFVGGAQSGFLMRPQAGLSFDILRSFNLSLGYEAAFLWYKVQNNNFRSDKYGITIGAGYNF